MDVALKSWTTLYNYLMSMKGINVHYIFDRFLVLVSYVFDSGSVECQQSGLQNTTGTFVLLDNVKFCAQIVEDIMSRWGGSGNRMLL